MEVGFLVQNSGEPLLTFHLNANLGMSPMCLSEMKRHEFDLVSFCFVSFSPFVFLSGMYSDCYLEMRCGLCSPCIVIYACEAPLLSGWFVWVVVGACLWNPCETWCFCGRGFTEVFLWWCESFLSPMAFSDFLIYTIHSMHMNTFDIHSAKQHSVCILWVLLLFPDL